MDRTEIEQKIDILEDDIADIDLRLLDLLIKDKTTGQNILWCTTDYEGNGYGYEEESQITVPLITRKRTTVIQPRAAKSKKIRNMRIKKRAEVFTPSWICNEQNSQVDEAWFGRANVFNRPNGHGWETVKEPIVFPGGKKTWKAYVDAKRLEITCGEAPYLVSRYDTTTGELIPVFDRIGLFDRKMRVVNENCTTDEEWLHWSFRALHSIYGYEFQGDSVLIARENLLYDFIDYYEERLGKEPVFKLLKDVANIIAWNIWQMDGLKCVVPYSCHPTVENKQLDFFGEETERYHPCPGCEKNDLFTHTGTYCRIFDWTHLKKSVLYISLFKGETTNG